MKRQKPQLRVTLDKAANAAYIYLTSIRPGGVACSFPLDTEEIRAWVVVDFDESGRLLGVEVLDASNRLPQDLLDSAEVIC